jgi:hypothetical protein
MGSSKCATASSTRCAGTSLLHTILRRQRLQRVITAIVAHLVENVPEAAAHGVPGSPPRGRGLRGSGAPSFSRRKRIDASAHPGWKGVTLANTATGPGTFGPVDRRPIPDSPCLDGVPKSYRTVESQPVRLDTIGIDIDVARFRAAAAAPGGGAEAIALYRGPLLQDFALRSRDPFSDWLAWHR